MLKLDALFNFLGVLMFFVITLLAQINPPTDPQIDPPGNLVASIVWPAGAIDVDLWVAGPNDKAVGYSNKAGKVWALLRDDLGTANDSMPINNESAFTRGLPDGEYVVNVRCFGCAGRVPVPVSVEIRLAEGGTVWTGVVDLVADKQERTALRWRMAGGAVVVGSESQVFRNIRGEG
ncbi:hypothetical protein EHS39_11425 [Ensifer sp. MPMI2T]|nr:hypothetical protein EHS39_11425 [Ensifer sp. MPMI2T]